MRITHVGWWHGVVWLRRASVVVTVILIFARVGSPTPLRLQLIYRRQRALVWRLASAPNKVLSAKLKLKSHEVVGLLVNATVSF
jgi:hypothetical protein